MFETIGIACVLLLLVAIVFIGVDLFTPRPVKPRRNKGDSWKS